MGLRKLPKEKQIQGQLETGMPGYSVSVFSSASPTTSASSNRLLILVTFIRNLSPGSVLGMKTSSPSILVYPSPRRLVSGISTSYSFPISTGFGAKPRSYHLLSKST